MTSYATPRIADDIASPNRLWKAVVARCADACRAALARAEARRAYRRMLQWDDEHLLRDIGISRGDVRQALRELDASR